jgi:predicted nucleotidyltransferase
MGLGFRHISPETLHMTLDELVTQLRSAYGNALRSVVLYGSAAAGGGEHVEKKSDYNVLIIVDAVPLDRLRELSAVTRAWREAGNHPPMTFTLSEWRSSSDIFAMEYADILERNKVLFGESPLGGIAVDRADLRLQVEREAMGVLLRLRGAVLLAGTDSDEQIKLMTASLSTLMVVFRAILRLAGRTPPHGYAEIASEVAAVSGVDAAPFATIARQLRDPKTVTKERARDVLGAYLSGMEAIAAYVSALPNTRP